MKKDLHELPKLRDSISFLYAEHAIIEQDDSSIILIQEDGKVPIPVASTTCLLLGPGTRITHSAIKAIADNGCMIVWCGEKAGHFYASGVGETKSASNLLLQAKLCMDEDSHMAVVRRMYERRFPALDLHPYTLQQIRGMEGVRVRKTYQTESKRTGVKWISRNYKNENWNSSDDINKALSYANTILYGVCHAAIVALGFSPGLGFIHTGKLRSFVYDIADLYKAEVTIPAAFDTVSNKPCDLYKELRRNCRARIFKSRIMKRIPEDISWIFDIPVQDEDDEVMPAGELWDGDRTIEGGRNHSEEV